MSTRRLSVQLDLDTSNWTGRLTAVGGQLRAFGGQVNQSNRAVKDMSGGFERMGHSMSTPLQKLRDYVLIAGNVRFALINLRDIAVGWVASLVKQSAEVERVTMLLKGMSTATTEAGRNKEAQQNFELITKLAKTSGFAIQQLGDSFVKFKSGGLDPTDGSLKSLVDAVSAFGGSSETLQRASVAIQQMSGKGVISMEELRQQLGEAVPTALKVMAKAAGQSVGEFTKQVSLGKVAAGPALKGMFDEFALMYAGSGYKLSQTLNGQLAQVKTNMLEISNEFTQLRSKADGAGNVTTAGDPGGLYDTITKSVKQLNVALSSQEGKNAARELGEAVNLVAKSIIWVTKTAIEWRSVIGFALTAIAAGFIYLKSVAVMTWLVQSMMAARTAVLGLNTSLAAGTGPLAILTQRSVQAAAAIRAKTAALQQAAVAQAASSVAATRNVAAITAEIARLTQLRTAYAANSIALQRNAAAALAALNAGRASGRFKDYETGQFISQSRAIEKNSLAHLANAQAKVNSARVARQLAAGETALAAAITVESGATTRSSAASAAAAVQTGFLTRAKLACAVAARGLGVAVNFALGPIGMIITALGFAAYQAGLFSSSADRAAASALNLASSMATLADAKDMQNQLERNERERTQLNSATFMGGVARNHLGFDSLFSGKNPFTATQKRLDQLAADDKVIRASINENSPRIQKTYGEELAQRLNQKLEIKENKWAGDYNAGTLSKEDYQKKSDTVRAAGVASLRKARAELAATGRSTVVVDAIIAKFNSTAESTAPAMNQAGAAMVGVGNDAAAAGKGTGAVKSAMEKIATAAENARDKYKNMLAGQAGDLAELKSEIDGAEGAFAKFEARRLGGIYDDATEAEIKALGNGFKAIDEAQAKINFNSGLKSLKKELVQTTAEADQMWASLLKGGNSFETDARAAQVKGQFSDKLALSGGDQTENIAKITDKYSYTYGDDSKIKIIDAELAKAELAQSRFLEIKKQMDEVIVNLGRMDAATSSRNWELMTEEIYVGLMGEDEARQANYDREIARQASLIDWEHLKGQEKIEVERRFESYRVAAAARYKRESESSTVKMARDWAKLGSNIDNALSGALSSFVDGMFDADFNFGKFAISMIKNLIKIIIQAAIAYAILSALGMANNSAGAPVSFGDYMKGSISSGFTGGGNSASSFNIGNPAASPVPVGTNHTGGYIGSSKNIAMVAGSLFNNAKTYHNGGMIGGRQLRSGEVPIIGMKGEQVLTEAQQRAIGNQGGAPSVQVNIINNSGTSLEAEQGEPQFNAKEMILNVVVEAASRRGPFRDAMKGMADG